MGERIQAGRQEPSREVIEVWPGLSRNCGKMGTMSSSDPDVQVFRENGTWIKPARAMRVDALIVAGGGGGSLGRDGENGAVHTWSRMADEIGDTVKVEIGRGGRGTGGGGDGADGIAVFTTLLAPDDPALPVDADGELADEPDTEYGQRNAAEWAFIWEMCRAHDADPQAGRILTPRQVQILARLIAGEWG